MNRISPYPGLRPFSEEEAIFFRGRENHISQIIQSLENNHFVMITGASGDGKSSIVYAGLVPKALALGTNPAYTIEDFPSPEAPVIITK